jgi:two-component system LytT family sensor kinase
MAALHERIEFYGGSFTSHIPLILIIKLCQAMTVYTLLIIFIPLFVKRNKYLLFFTSVILSSVICGIVTAFAIKIYCLMISSPTTISLLYMAIPLSIDVLIISGIFIAAKIIYDNYKNNQTAKLAEKNRLQSELDFLRAQLNPHFLFNSINSIFVLIDVDRNLASETLLKFSGMLRYQLYECNSNTVSIYKELEFTRDYIGLETLRKENCLKVDFKVSDKMRSFDIPPFLLIPFVENAFKHVSRHTDKLNFISINAQLLNGIFVFTVQNTSNEYEVNKSGGIGLQNVRRRLDLVFGEQYKLEIVKSDSLFTSKLEIYV